MDRRIGSRAQVDFPVGAFVDGFRHDCRAVDLSPTGMVLMRGRSLRLRPVPWLNELELLWDSQRIDVCARTVWTKGHLHAVRFVIMQDVDRLEIAERLDDMLRRKQTLH